MRTVASLPHTDAHHCASAFLTQTQTQVPLVHAPEQLWHDSGSACRQVNEYVERELANHRQLIHPHIIQFKEVLPASPAAL